MNMKEAVCRRCGKPIWLIECRNSGKWLSCDRELYRFHPGGGLQIYVTEDGKLERGSKAVVGGIYGYRKHRKDCDQR